MDVYIDGQLVTTAADSVSVSDRIEERTVASFTVIDMQNQYDFKKGMPVTIDNNLTYQNAELTWAEADFGWGEDDTLFTGWIDKPVKSKPYNDGVYYHDISCIDSHYLADKRIIAKAYEDQYVGDIIEDIWDQYLQGEGVTLGTVEQGSFALEAVFNYIPVTDAINSLAEKAGFWWRIDHDKKLHFRSRASNLAPFDVSNDSVYVQKGSIKCEHSNPQYRNKQYVKGGKDVTDAQTEIKLGDGENKTFTVGYPIAKVPTVEVDTGSGYVTKTVGIRGLDEGKDWYWSKGDSTITQDSAGTVLGATHKIKITYQGEFDIVAVTFDSDQIETMKDREGVGSGIVEDVFEDKNITGREAAFSIANSKIKKFGSIDRKVNFTIMKKGLQPGQLVTVDFPQYGVDNLELLVTSVDVYTEDMGQTIYYAIESVQGVNNQTWTAFFSNIAKQAKQFVVRENISESEVLVTVETFDKDWYVAETPSLFTSTIAGASTYPGSSTYPMFAASDQVKYLAWYVSGVEAGRKQITKRINGVDDILTITYINPNEGNVNISHLGWFGGINATMDTGTGIEIDKQAFTKTKTELESLQIEKTDTNIDCPTATGTQLTPLYLSTREQEIYDLTSYAEAQAAILIAKSL